MLGAAASFNLLSPRASEVALIVGALTMAATPLLSMLGKQIGKKLEPPKKIDPSTLAPVYAQGMAARQRESGPESTKTAHAAADFGRFLLQIDKIVEGVFLFSQRAWKYEDACPSSIDAFPT